MNPLKFQIIFTCIMLHFFTHVSVYIAWYNTCNIRIDVEYHDNNQNLLYLLWLSEQSI